MTTLKPPRILVMDDTSGSRHAAARALRRVGMDVVEAESGGEGLALAHDGVDLVVLASTFPDMSDDEVRRALKETPATSGIPVLQLSASDVEELDCIGGLDSGADGYLTHPFDPAVFIVLVRTLLRTAEVERRLVLAKEETERANAAKADLLATMSHELRTPLNAIAGYVDLMLLGVHGPLTDRQRTDLERVRRSQTHLLLLINDVLSFARVKRGGIAVQRARVPVLDVVRRSRELIAPQADAKGITYVESCDPSLVANADADKMQQILVNLLGNAVKFTPSGGQVSVCCSSDGPQVLVSVADTGIGIPDARLADIFQPFVQIDRHLTPDGDQGVGLGLSISRELATVMQGDLTVRSENGRGTVFTLRLEAPQQAA